MAHRLTHPEQLIRSEDMTASAALRPVLDDFVYRACRQQLAAVTFVPRLGTPRSPRAILSSLWP
jgi:hypothetical protein